MFIWSEEHKRWRRQFIKGDGFTKLLEKDKGISWQKEFFSIPNCLCYLRVLMVPLFIWLYFDGDPHKPNWDALVVLAASGLTDCLDGLIARKYNMVTEWGKIIDPVADKLTQLSVACCLGIRMPPMLVLFAVVLVKEVVTGIVTLVKLKDGLRIDSAMWFGKVATAVFYVVMVVIIGFGSVLPETISMLLIWITIALMLFAFIRYLIVLLRLKKE